MGQKESWMGVMASKHLPGGTEGYRDKLQLSKAQYEAVVLPGAGDYHKVKNEQTVHNDFLHMAKLGQEKQTSTAPNCFPPNPIAQSGLNTIFIQYFKSTLGFFFYSNIQKLLRTALKLFVRQYFTSL